MITGHEEDKKVILTEKSERVVIALESIVYYFNVEISIRLRMYQTYYSSYILCTKWSFLLYEYICV